MQQYKAPIHSLAWFATVDSCSSRSTQSTWSDSRSTLQEKVRFVDSEFAVQSINSIIDKIHRPSSHLFKLRYRLILNIRDPHT